MSSNVLDLANYLQPLLERLSVGERARLAKQIGRDLRKSQGKRISEQKNPDGSSYTPRRKRLREQKGKIKRKMFTKLKNTSNLKVLSTADSIAIGFVGRVARIARVHQEGLKDRAEKGAPDVVYPKRELLGFTDQEIKLVEDSFLKHIKL
ncbi:phage virion morphogenesis protein [Acinetobacter bohemicus]|uniref:phage virion morphogenesis protein n=1 Tax=Acinetobacter TaxID=469 RepID=UPI00209AE691|nr:MULTISPECIES: phage virion morphogenesis protein [Acinetobacter]MCO8043465.1 phage virion morphogenesis protein [Acinetobacter sp. S4400-12]MCU7225827.1 phage virion morphogenesis protein [Acinetobacter bohemicus]